MIAVLNADHRDTAFGRQSKKGSPTSSRRSTGSCRTRSRLEDIEPEPRVAVEGTDGPLLGLGSRSLSVLLLLQSDESTWLEPPRACALLGREPAELLRNLGRRLPLRPSTSTRTASRSLRSGRAGDALPGAGLQFG